jgi:hypothetical protein
VNTGQAVSIQELLGKGGLAHYSSAKVNLIVYLPQVFLLPMRDISPSPVVVERVDKNRAILVQNYSQNATL